MTIRLMLLQEVLAGFYRYILLLIAVESLFRVLFLRFCTACLLNVTEDLIYCVGAGLLYRVLEKLQCIL